MEYPLLTNRGPNGGTQARVPYGETGVGYREIFDRHASEAHRVCFVRWDRINDFILAVMPRVRIGDPVTSGGVPQMEFTHVKDREFDASRVYYQKFQRRAMHRLDPEAHPRMPWLHVSKVELMGMGVFVTGDTSGAIGGVGALTPAKERIRFLENVSPPADGIAQLALTYTRYPFTNPIGTVSDEDTNLPETPVATARWGTDASTEILRYVSREFKPAQDSFTIPATRMQLFEGGANTIIPEAMSKFVNKTHLVYTWHMVPQIPLTCGSLRGHVNDFKEFDREGIKLIEGTDRISSDVLYLYPDIGDPYAMCDGVEVRDIKYHMILRKPGNNCAYRHGSDRTIDDLGRGRYAGWSLAVRKIEATDPLYTVVPGAVRYRAPFFPHKPGLTLYPYANLRSLFTLLVEGARDGVGDTTTVTLEIGTS